MWDYQICMMEKKNHILEYNGKKIVYKTRDSYNDLFWNGIINWVNGKSSDNLLFGVRTLNKQTYSWHEYISYSELHLEDKVQEYYYKIGFEYIFFSLSI